MKGLRYWVVGVLSLGLVAFFCSPVLAADETSSDKSFNLVTSPLPISLVGKPGTTLSTSIRVKNNSNHSEQLKVTLMKFSAFGEEGKPALTEREAGDDYFDWVSFSPTTFNAPQNEWVDVSMTIKLPKAAAFGYYYAVVFSRAGAAPEAQEKQIVSLGSTAVLALVEAENPGAKRVASIVSFSVDKNSREFLPANFSVKINNSGNIHLVPKGNIYISKRGKTISTLSVNVAAGNILPSSNRVFTASWEDGFPVYVKKESGGKDVLNSEGKPEYTLKWDFTKLSKLRFGHYTAHLLLAYDNGTSDVPLEATLSFWVIPWRIIGVAVAFLALLAFGLWSIVRAVHKKVRRTKG